MSNECARGKAYSGRKNEISKIRIALQSMAPAVRQAVKAIAVLGEAAYQKHYPFYDNSAAHCHSTLSRDQSTVCLRRGRFTAHSVWHEAAHARYAQLPADAKKEYAEIAGKVYVGYDLARRDRRRFPRDGLLGRHSGANQNEDIAYWVAEINECAADPEHYRGPLWEVNWDDPRNLAKVWFFKKWEFIKTTQFEAIRKFQKRIAKK